MDDPASLLLLFAAEIETAPEVPTLLVTLAKIFLVVFLVLANGFFVASEFALVAVRKSRIEALAAEGDTAAKRLVRMLNNLSATFQRHNSVSHCLRLDWDGSASRSSRLCSSRG